MPRRCSFRPWTIFAGHDKSAIPTKVLQRLIEQPSGGLIIDELIQSAKQLLEEWEEVDATET